MKYNILGYDQRALIEHFKKYNIRGDELITLRVITDLIGVPRFENTILDGKIYTWLKLSRIMKEIPFILTSRRTAQRRINKLIKAGLLERIVLNEKELPSGKIQKGSYGYYAKTQLNHDMQYSKDKGMSEVAHRGYDKSGATKSNSTKEVIKSSTKYLHDSVESRHYKRFDSLGDTDIVKQINKIISPSRSKITEDNYLKASDKFDSIISELDIDHLNEFIGKYMQDKSEGRSVENFIGHLERYERSM